MPIQQDQKLNKFSKLLSSRSGDIPTSKEVQLMLDLPKTKRGVMILPNNVKRSSRGTKKDKNDADLNYMVKRGRRKRRGKRHDGDKEEESTRKSGSPYITDSVNDDMREDETNEEASSVSQSSIELHRAS